MGSDLANPVIDILFYRKPNLDCSAELMGIYTSDIARKYCTPISFFLFYDVGEKESLTDFFS